MSSYVPRVAMRVGKESASSLMGVHVTTGLFHNAAIMAMLLIAAKTKTISEHLLNIYMYNHDNISK